MENKTSQYLFGTSISLQGFCFFIITTIHLFSNEERTLIDEFAALLAICLSITSFLSFLSIRTQNLRSKKRYELIAEYIFISSMIGIITVILAIVLKIIK